MPPEGNRTQKRGKCFSVSIKKEEELLKELNHTLKRKKKTQKAQAFLLHVYIFLMPQGQALSNKLNYCLAHPHPIVGVHPGRRCAGR